MADKPILAYLTSAYARAADTFIRGEVRQLRAMGFTVHTFSIRRSEPEQMVSEDVREEQASTDYILGGGKGRLFSYVIHHRPVPGFTPPYAIAVVELDEGPRMMTNITDCPQTPEALQLDMPVEVAFEKLDDDITLPLFRPAGAAIQANLRETTTRVLDSLTARR